MGESECRAVPLPMIDRGVCRGKEGGGEKEEDERTTKKTDGAGEKRCVEERQRGVLRAPHHHHHNTRVKNKTVGIYTGWSFHSLFYSGPCGKQRPMVGPIYRYLSIQHLHKVLPSYRC